jgi:hypothetical protein
MSTRIRASDRNANLPEELVMTSYFSIRDNKNVSLAVIFNQLSPY